MTADSVEPHSKTIVSGTRTGDEDSGGFTSVMLLKRNQSCLPTFCFPDEHITSIVTAQYCK